MTNSDSYAQDASSGGQQMKDRVVLITGASRGIGAATARLFARYGATVAVNYHSSSQAAEQVVAEIEAHGGKAKAIRASIDTPTEVEQMVQQVEEELGPIDTLVMNAAPVKKFIFAPFIDFSWEDFEGMVMGELAGIFHPARAVAPRMIARKKGNLIAVSSTVSKNAREGMCAHSAGKSGVDALVKVLAQELGPHGIRVNTVAPGLVATEASSAVRSEHMVKMLSDMTPLRRIAQPEDVAGAILLLASDEARFITGTYVPVSGGLYMP